MIEKMGLILREIGFCLSQFYCSFIIYILFEMSYFTLIYFFFLQKYGIVEVKEMDLIVLRFMLRFYFFYEVMFSR